MWKIKEEAEFQMGSSQSVQDKEDGSERERTIDNQGTTQTKYNATNIYACLFIFIVLKGDLMGEKCPNYQQLK